MLINKYMHLVDEVVRASHGRSERTLRELEGLDIATSRRDPSGSPLRRNRIPSWRSRIHAPPRTVFSRYSPLKERPGDSAEEREGSHPQICSSGRMGKLQEDRKSVV